MGTVTKDNAKTFGDWAYVAIAKHFNKILKHETEVLKDKDPEELHQMRVGMRRLRSAIAGFSPALDLPKAAREKKVGKVARVLGELRDIDVLEEALKTEYQPILTKKENKRLDEALEVLENQRKKTFEDVKDTLNNDVYKNLKQSFKDWLEQPKYQEIGSVNIQDILPDLLLPQISKLLLHPGWLVGIEFEEEDKPSDELPKTKVEKLLEEQSLTLHSLRKEAKRSRYNMDLFTQFYGDTYQNYLNDIKEIQSILGAIQDCFVLAKFLGKTFESNITKQMPSLAEKLTETRFKKWQAWKKLQCKFLEPKTRQDLHITVLKPNLNSHAVEEK